MKLKKLHSLQKEVTYLLSQHRTAQNRKKVKKSLNHLEKLFQDWCCGQVFGEVKKEYNRLFEEYLLITWKDTPSQLSENLLQLLKEQASSSISELMSGWRMEKLDHKTHANLTDALLCKLTKAFQRDELHPLLLEQLLEIVIKNTMNAWQENEDVVAQNGWLDLKNKLVGVLKTSAATEKLPEFISSRLPKHNTTMESHLLSDVYFEALLESWRKGLISSVASDWLQIKLKPVLHDYIRDDSNFSFWKDTIESSFRFLIKDMLTFDIDMQHYEHFVLSHLRDCIYEEDIQLLYQYAVKAIRKEWQNDGPRKNVKYLIDNYIANHTVIPIQEWIQSLRRYLQLTLKELIYKQMKTYCIQDAKTQVLYSYLKAGEDDGSTDHVIIFLLDDMSEKLREIMESKASKLYQYMLQREKVHSFFQDIVQAYSQGGHGNLIFNKLYFSLLSHETFARLIEKTTSILYSLVIKDERALHTLEEAKIFTQLSKLTISFCTALQSVFLLVPKLEKLSLFECPQLRTIHIDSTFLKSVDIENCSQIMLDHLFGRFFPALTSLRLVQFYNMHRLLINAPSLEKLVLARCPQLEFIQTGSKQLKEVILSFCDALILNELSTVAEQTYFLKTFQIDRACYTLPAFIPFITRYPTLLQHSNDLSKLTSDELAVFEEYYVRMKDEDDWFKYMKVHMQTHIEKLSSSVFWDASTANWHSILSDEQQDFPSQCIAACNLACCQPLDDRMVNVLEKGLINSSKQQLQALQSLANVNRYDSSYITILVTLMSEEKYMLKATDLLYEYCHHGFLEEIVKVICEELKTCPDHTPRSLLEFAISLYDCEQLEKVEREKLIATFSTIIRNASSRMTSVGLYSYKERLILTTIRALFRWGQGSIDLISLLCFRIRLYSFLYRGRDNPSNSDDYFAVLRSIFEIISSSSDVKLHKYMIGCLLELLNDVCFSKSEEGGRSEQESTHIDNVYISNIIIDLLVNMNVMNDSNIVRKLISIFFVTSEEEKMIKGNLLFDNVIPALAASRVFFITFLNCLLYESNSFDAVNPLLYKVNKYDLNCFLEELSKKIPISFQEDIFDILQNSVDEPIIRLLLFFLSNSSKIDGKFEPILCSIFSKKNNTRKIQTKALYLLRQVESLSSFTLEMIVSLANGVETAPVDYLACQKEEWLEKWFEENKECIKRQSSAIKTLGMLNLESFSTPDRNKVIACLHNLEKHPFLLEKILHSLISLGEGEKTNAIYALKLGNVLAGVNSCGWRWGGIAGQVKLIWNAVVAVYGLNEEGMLTVIDALEKNDIGAMKLFEIFTGMICKEMGDLDRKKLVYTDKDIRSLSKPGYIVLKEYLLRRLKQKEFPIAFYIIDYLGYRLKVSRQPNKYLSILLNVLTEDWENYRTCKLIKHKDDSENSDSDTALSEYDEDDIEEDKDEIKEIVKEHHFKLCKNALKYIEEYATCNRLIIETLIQLLGTDNTDNKLQKKILNTLERLNYAEAGEVTSLMIHYFLPFLFDSSDDDSSDEDSSDGDSSDDEQRNIDSNTAYEILKKLHVSQMTDHDFDFFIKILLYKANPDGSDYTSEYAAYELIKHFAKQLDSKVIQFINIFLDVYSPHDERFQKLAESLFSNFLIDAAKLHITRDLLIRLNMNTDPSIRKFSAELAYTLGERVDILRSILGKWSSKNIKGKNNLPYLYRRRFFENKEQSSSKYDFSGNTASNSENHYSI